MPLISKKTLLLVFILISVLSNEAFSEEDQVDEGVFRRVFRGLSISPGISLKSPEIKIKRKSDSQSAGRHRRPSSWYGIPCYRYFIKGL